MMLFLSVFGYQLQLQFDKHGEAAGVDAEDYLDVSSETVPLGFPLPLDTPSPYDDEEEWDDEGQASRPACLP